MQTATVDLTSIDIRRGTLYLPRRLYDAMSEGELTAVDTATGERMEVRFTPPRELEGLSDFFEHHELKPNDGVSLHLSGAELQLSPVRRERRRASRAPEVSRVVKETEPLNQHGGSWSFLGSGHEPQQDTNEAGEHEFDVSAELPADDIAAASRFEDRFDFVTAPPADAAENDDTPAGPEAQLDPARAEDTHDPLLQGDEPGGGVDEWLKAPRDLSRAFGSRWGSFLKRRPANEAQPGEALEAGAEPTAPVPPAPRTSQPDSEWVREVRRAPRASAGPLQPEASPEPQPQEAGPEREPQAPRAAAAETERELVAVGAQSGASAVEQVANYLGSPSTPAIVRVNMVAQELGIDPEVARTALSQVARNSDGAVTPIRADVYLVKRSQG